MKAAIEVSLHKISDKEATVDLRGPEGKSAHAKFPLIWLDDKEWMAVFLTLELHRQDSTTWPKNSEFINKAESLGLFSNDRPSDHRLEIIGKKLYESVFSSKKISRLFDRLFWKNYDNIPIVQLRLPDEGSILYAYPWELLHDGEEFLFDARQAFLVRYIDFDRPVPRIKKKSLQILLIDPRPEIPSGPDSLPLTLDRPHLERVSNQHPNKFVIRDLSSILGPRPTLSKIQRYLTTSPDDVHILHIDAHGDFGWLCHECGTLNPPNVDICRKCKSLSGKQEAQGYLAFEDEIGKLDWISGYKLGRYLMKRGIQVVVLSACKSGLVGGSNAFNSIAGALIKQGIPSVIAMQFSIDVNAAKVFVDSFYHALIMSKNLTEAVAEARISLRGNFLEDDFWYRPVLYLRTDPNNYRGEVFIEVDTSNESTSGKETQAQHQYSSKNISIVSGVSKLELEPPNRPVSPNSIFYIERAADNYCWKHFNGIYAQSIYVQASRQMGKSSLMHRILYRANKEHNKKFAFIDLQKFPEHFFLDENSFFLEFCYAISDGLKIPPTIDQYWQVHRPIISKCSRYLSEYVIPQINQSFVLAVDEVERVLLSPFCDDFFTMLSSWHNNRAYNDDFARLTLFLSGSLDLDPFMQNPFSKVAVPILLDEFTIEEVDELHRHYNSPLNQKELDDLWSLIGGHPYLTRQALHLIVNEEIDLATLLVQATADIGPFGHHLHYLFNKFLKKSEAKQALLNIHRNGTCEEDQIFHHLLGAGLIKKVEQQIVLRNNLYIRYFEEHLKF